MDSTWPLDMLMYDLLTNILQRIQVLANPGKLHVAGSQKAPAIKAGPEVAISKRIRSSE